VSAALEAGRPVVALESTIIAHGLPRPDNLRIAREIEGVVREHGATADVIERPADDYTRRLVAAVPDLGGEP
jgi:pseudouridine-5'-phosphate glycosidase